MFIPLWFLWLKSVCVRVLAGGGTRAREQQHGKSGEAGQRQGGQAQSEEDPAGGDAAVAFRSASRASDHTRHESWRLQEDDQEEEGKRKSV